MKTFEKIKIGMVVIATAALALALPVFAESKEGESEEEVKLSDCPAAVQKTINDNAGSGKVVEVEKETGKDGTVVYEAEVKKSNGDTVEIKVASDGKLIKVEAENEEEESGEEDDDDGEDENEEENDNN